MRLCFMILSVMTFGGRSSLRTLKNSIFVTVVSVMQFLAAEIWIMAEFMKISYAWNCFAVAMMFM